MTGPTLVTGAAGFAGSHLVDQLAADRVDVVGWHRPGGAPHQPLPGVRWQAIDILERSSVFEAISALRPAVVFHCAGAAHVGQSWATVTQTMRVNVMGTHHLVEALRAAAPDAKLLITSSAHIYGSSPAPIDESHPIAPDSPYALSKVAQELAGAGNGGRPQVYIARPFNHVGPRQDPSFVASAFARQIAQIETGLIPPVLRVGNLEARRDLTDVRDTVRAYIALMAHGHSGAVYNVCTGVAGRVGDILDTLHALARVPIDIGTDPALLRPSDTPVVLGSHERLTRDTGWRPTIGLDTTLRDLLDAWRATVRAEHRQA